MSEGPPFDTDREGSKKGRASSKKRLLREYVNQDSKDDFENELANLGSDGRPLNDPGDMSTRDRDELADLLRKGASESGPESKQEDRVPVTVETISEDAAPLPAPERKALGHNADIVTTELEAVLNTPVAEVQRHEKENAVPAHKESESEENSGVVFDDASSEVSETVKFSPLGQEGKAGINLDTIVQSLRDTETPDHVSEEEQRQIEIQKKKKEMDSAMDQIRRNEKKQEKMKQGGTKEKEVTSSRPEDLSRGVTTTPAAEVHKKGNRRKPQYGGGRSRQRQKTHDATVAGAKPQDTEASVDGIKKVATAPKKHKETSPKQAKTPLKSTDTPPKKKIRNEMPEDVSSTHNRVAEQKTTKPKKGIIPHKMPEDISPGMLLKRVKERHVQEDLRKEAPKAPPEKEQTATQRVRAEYQQFTESVNVAKQVYYEAIDEYVSHRNKSGFFKKFLFKDEHYENQIREAEEQYNALLKQVHEKREERVLALTKRIAERRRAHDKEAGPNGKKWNQSDEDVEQKIVSIHEALVVRQLNIDAGELERMHTIFGEGADLERMHTIRGERVDVERFYKKTKGVRDWYASRSAKQKVAIKVAIAAGVGALVGALTGGAGAAVVAAGRRGVGALGGATAGAATAGAIKGYADKKATKYSTTEKANVKDELLQKNSIADARRRITDIRKTERAKKRRGTVAAVGAAALMGRGSGILTGELLGDVLPVASTGDVLSDEGVSAKNIHGHSLGAEEPVQEVTVPETAGAEQPIVPESVAPDAHEVVAIKETEEVPPEIMHLLDKNFFEAEEASVPQEVSPIADHSGMYVNGLRPVDMVDRLLTEEHWVKEQYNLTQGEIGRVSKRLVEMMAHDSEKATDYAKSYGVVDGDWSRAPDGARYVNALSQADITKAIEAVRSGATPSFEVVDHVVSAPNTLTFEGSYEGGSSVERELQQFLKGDEWVKEKYPNLTEAEVGAVAHRVRLELMKQEGMVEALKVHSDDWNTVWKDDAYSTKIDTALIEKHIEAVRGGSEAVQQTSVVAEVPEKQIETAPQAPETVEDTSRLRTKDFMYARGDLEAASDADPRYHGLETRAIVEDLFKRDDVFSDTLKGQRDIIRAHYGPISQLKMQDVFDNDKKLTYVPHKATQVVMGADTEALMQLMVTQMELGLQKDYPAIEEIIEEGTKKNYTIGEVMKRVGTMISETDRAADVSQVDKDIGSMVPHGTRESDFETGGGTLIENLFAKPNIYYIELPEPGEVSKEAVRLVNELEMSEKTMDYTSAAQAYAHDAVYQQKIRSLLDTITAEKQEVVTPGAHIRIEWDTYRGLDPREALLQLTQRMIDNNVSVDAPDTTLYKKAA